MKNIKAEFFNKTDAYNAINTVKNLCANIEIDSGGSSDRRKGYLSNLNMRHDFFNSGAPGFMSINMGFPQFNGMTWGSFGLNDTFGGGYDRYDGYDGVFFTGTDEEITTINIQVEEEKISKLKNKLYSAGAVAVFNA